jgi:hypothetical protein
LKEAAMQNRAYSVLSIKAIDDRRRVIQGVATTPTVDRVGDIIEPLGVSFTNPLAFLWQHRHDMPVGSVKFDKPTADGITFEAEFVHPDTVESLSLKDRLQEAWDSIKTGLVRAVSVGFRPIEYAFMENGGVRFTAVTIPANSEALITTIKSIDARLRAAAGVPEPEIPPKDAAAATGKTARVVKLDAPARDRAEPFVIRTIRRTK